MEFAFWIKNKKFSMMKNASFLIFAICLFLFSCNEKTDFGHDISTNAENIIAGKAIFNQNCSSCHNFQQTTIGPNLSGLTRQVESDWIKRMIQNPKSIIDDGDPRAVGLYQKYKTYMPAFPQFNEHELDALLSYLHTFEELPSQNGSTGLDDPIPNKIPDSGIRLELEFLTQIPPSDTIPPLAKITKLESERVSGRTFVQDQRGVMYELKNGKHQVYFPLRDLRPNLMFKPGLATGFGSYAFHPEFYKNGLLYTSHSEKGKPEIPDFGYADSIKVTLQWVLTEWKTANPNSEKFTGSSRELLRIDFVTQIHGMQEISFNPHSKPGEPDYGKLFIGIGDGGSAENGFAFIADHQGSDVWSSILRIDPAGKNSKNGQYGIPADNPFFGQAGKAGEVFAYGFRNPNRVFWDPQGRLLATEIGHKNIEELNGILPGKFYGWPVREGSFVINPYGDMSRIFQLPKDDSALGAVLPLIQLDHDELAAIIGGYFVKNGPHAGKFLFGDVPSGRLFISDLSDWKSIKVETWGITYQGKEMSLEELCGSPRVDLKFGQDKSGQLYLMTKADGKIYKIKGI
jgi:mono/diheme cytochrome c family protein